MEEMSKKTKRLEKDNLSLTRKHEATNANIIKMAEERTRSQKEMDLLRKKNANLEKLCRGMQAQGRMALGMGMGREEEMEEEEEVGESEEESEYEYEESEEEEEVALEVKPATAREVVARVNGSGFKGAQVNGTVKAG